MEKKEKYAGYGKCIWKKKEMKEIYVQKKKVGLLNKLGLFSSRKKILVIINVIIFVIISLKHAIIIITPFWMMR